jgi:glucose/arabinose dehydrogenase
LHVHALRRRRTRIAIIAALIALGLFIAGCYSVRPSRGAGQIGPATNRQFNVADVLVPAGYLVSLAASNLTFPTGVAFDDTGEVYVVESGYSYGEVWTTPRLLHIERGGTIKEIARGERNGPWTGVTFHAGKFYVAEGGVLEGGRILRIELDGKVAVIVSNLPSFGDHHANAPLVGPDGWLYFTQGTASNSGIVGEDNAQFGWLKRKPEFHDIPGQNIELVGRNFTSRDPLNPKAGRVTTGAFLPFGQASTPGQVVPGQVPCSGAVLRVRPEGGQMELVAWGFRNPFGLAFTPDGRLFATENSYDDRGSRPVWGAPDVLWEVTRGIWYGWPDFAAGIPITHFKPPHHSRPEFLLAKHPNPPPKPVAKFAVHASANGFDISRSSDFGHEGEAFVALFGDEAPAVGKVLHPVGVQVVRVDLKNGVSESFAVNRGKKNGPASFLGNGGLERPVAARFRADGRELYIVDFGVLRHDAKGAHPVTQTGSLWRISREPTHAAKAP